jgi:uncharacterized membrane protein YphA (DoxX/SURF4 family)
MTLLGLLIRIAIAAAILTGLNYLLKKTKPEWADIKSWPITVLQNFCGALFIFSGYVKAVDPKGTAYKMQDYFAAFEATASESFLSFMAPIFPAMSEWALAFSLFMIILEIILGIMLLLGYTRKLTAWLFLIIVLFFTVLTGFTFLTGYVPSGVNFFSFGQWGEFVKSNMQVTDCGCFGDFIKLEPRTSFLKDVALLVPSFIFIFFTSKKHVLFSKGLRDIIVLATTVITTLFSFYGTFWNLPIQDFRPFKNGTDVRATKAAEEKAMTEAKVFYKLKNKNNGNTQLMPMNEYLKVFNDPTFKAEWEMLDQVREEVKTTKISEFGISNEEGTDITEDLLNYPGYHLMAVSYKLKYKEYTEKAVAKDTLFATDTIAVEGFKDSFNYVQRVVEVKDREYTATRYDWNEAFAKKYAETVTPFFAEAEKDKVLVWGVTKPYDPAMIDEFRHHVQAAYPFYTADDILLKTIVRSNPGVVLWKDGKIIKKWHISKLPDWKSVKEAYIK